MVETHDKENKCNNIVLKNKSTTDTSTEDKPEKSLLGSSLVLEKANNFASKAKSDHVQDKKGWKDGFDEDDEEEGYEEGEEDWEWDYGEQWDEGSKQNDQDSKEEEKSETEMNLPVSEEKVGQMESAKPLVSLNPLPPESLVLSEREKSSEPTGADEGSDDETGASSNGDVEDNDIEDEKKRSFSISFKDAKSLLKNLAIVDPLRLNNDKFDPHMQKLCMGISSLATAEINTQDPDNSDISTNYQTAESEVQAGPAATDEAAREREVAKQRERLKHEWTARTLTSLAPRYQAKPSECSVYSCLNQFTQSELLTGPNKWACDRCTQAAKEKQSNGEEERLDGPAAEAEKPARPRVVYSNASKQLLIFTPPRQS